MGSAHIPNSRKKIPVNFWKKEVSLLGQIDKEKVIDKFRQAWVQKRTKKKTTTIVKTENWLEQSKIPGLQSVNFNESNQSA